MAEPGLRHHPGKVTYSKGYRKFESFRFRQMIEVNTGFAVLEAKNDGWKITQPHLVSKIERKTSVVFYFQNLEAAEKFCELQKQWQNTN